MRWRLLRRCLLFGLLGLVTAVVVAWGVSAHWQLRDRHPPHMAKGVGAVDGITVSVTAHRGPGLYSEEWWLTDPVASGQRVVWQILERPGIGGRAPAEPDASVQSRRGDALAARGPRPGVTNVAPGQTRVQSVRAGWPLPALRWASRTDYDGKLLLPGARTTTTARIELPWSDARAGSIAAFTGTIVLPLQPRAGLLLNTIFYALLWFIILLIPQSIRSARRRARGRCPKCGYSLRGQPAAGCPECGDGRQVPAATPRVDRASSRPRAKAPGVTEDHLTSAF